MSLKREYDESNTDLNKKRCKKCNTITLKPSSQLQTVYLNSDKTSWIKLQKINEPDGLSMNEFEELWKIKPTEKLQIKIAGKIIYCPRYSKSYLKPYIFSGLVHEADLNVPKRVETLLEYCRQLRPELNQSLINWYEHDGSIGKHSDDTRQLLPDSEIFSLSFGPGKRIFVVEPKNKNDDQYSKFHVEVEHNTLVIMGGKCQQTHYHSVPKKSSSIGFFQSGQSERRLNITFRCFK